MFEGRAMTTSQAFGNVQYCTLIIYIQMPDTLVRNAIMAWLPRPNVSALVEPDGRVRGRGPRLVG